VGEFAAIGESLLTLTVLYKWLGFLCGLVIILITFFALYKVAGNLSLGLVSMLACIGMGINMLNQLGTIVQFLLVRRIIPMMRWLFNIVTNFINYNDWFLYFILVATLLMPLVLWRKSLHPSSAYSNSAERRKIIASSLRQRRWSAVLLVAYVLLMVSLTWVKAYNERDIVVVEAVPVVAQDGKISIPTEEINDGHLHRYGFTASNGTEVRFIVIKKNEVAYGLGLDACDICGIAGYYERDGQVICKQCGVMLNTSTIGFRGGCNPAPLTYEIQDGKMVIPEQELEAGKGRFE
jgi:uncharacterized membrane protein